MSIFKRLFGSHTLPAAQPQQRVLTEREQAIQSAANELWKMLEEILQFYYADGCACQYPRFHQYVKMDCTDTGKSFYMSETEGFIELARPYFTIQEIAAASENYRSEYTCNTCGSVYICGWSDFSIHVSRTYLKIVDKKAEDRGAGAVVPMPFYVGLFGHALPPREDFVKVDAETLKKYLLERRNS